MGRGISIDRALRRAWRGAAAVALLLCAGSAFALGLGQIKVMSKAGEPLLAEIPLVASDPSELESLKVALASPETFSRIGLDPPQGIVSNLQFMVALDPRGNPVVRVTSTQPVLEPQLVFLLEIDWDRGRLTREYSALIASPSTVAAVVQPSIDAPLQAPANAIVRAPEIESAAARKADAFMAKQTEDDTSAEDAESPADADGAIAPTPAPRPRATAPTVLQASAVGEDGYRIQAGDTLSKIAAQMTAPGATLDQTMIALLRENPDAFIKGNINLIRRGATLRTPDIAAQTQYGAAEARALVREQIGQWRAMSAPPPQPVAVAGETAHAPAAAGTTASRGSDARLEIIPPSANSGQRAGTQSGLDTGGEGDMLRQQQLQQANETIVARDAEVQELKARVAQLENLQQDQQKLISMKDSALAASQQNLANRQADAATGATAAGQSPQPLQPPMLWPWIVAALLMVVIAAWLVARRRTVAKPKRPAFDTAALAASVPVAPRHGGERIIDAEIVDNSDADPVRSPAPSDAFAAHADAAPAAAPPASSTPTWHAGAATHPDGSTRSELSTPRAAVVAPAAAETFATADTAAGYTATSLNSVPGGSERVELARAYVDLGDTETARSLLQEVIDGGDAASRDEATQLLRELA